MADETIYRAVYVQTRGRLRADLRRGLRRRSAAVSADSDAFMISRRPPEISDRAVPGHWEADLIMGSTESAVGTLVERTSRFVILLHLPGRPDAESIAAAMLAELGRLPDQLCRSLTGDRGAEPAEHATIRLDLELPVYFCDPDSPWQSGSNENTNRLLRFWLEEGTDLSRHSAEDLHRISATLNQRPRPTLHLRTPGQALNELLTGFA